MLPTSRYRRPPEKVVTYARVYTQNSDGTVNYSQKAIVREVYPSPPPRQFNDQKKRMKKAKKHVAPPDPPIRKVAAPPSKPVDRRCVLSLVNGQWTVVKGERPAPTSAPAPSAGTSVPNRVASFPPPVSGSAAPAPAVQRRLPPLRYTSKAAIIPTVHNEWSDIKFTTREEDGIDDHHSPNAYQELNFGLDFGTSTVKVVIYEKDDSHSGYAIPFLEDRPGIDAYLLPSTLYIDADHDTCSLEPTPNSVERDSSPKLTLMSNLDSPRAQQHVIGLLAHAIRLARSWFFKSYPKYALPTVWNVRIGVPSDAKNSTLIGLWRRLLEAAWHVAGTEGPVTFSAAAAALEAVPVSPEEDNNPLYVNYDENDAGFNAVPEVIAETTAILENHPLGNKGQDYLIIDIGSGTVDAAAFTLSKSPVKREDDDEARYYKTDLVQCVTPLGTTNCHWKRLDWLRAHVQSDKSSGQLPPAHADELLNTLRKERAHTLRTPFRNDVRNYVVGISLSDNVDDMLKDELFIEVTSHIKSSLRRENKLSEAKIAGLQVFLCGGGARSSFYQDALQNNDIAKNRSWLATTISSVNPTLRDIIWATDHPVRDPMDEGRFLVACGLSYSIQTHDLPQEQSDCETEDSWQDVYVDKDMM